MTLVPSIIGAMKLMPDTLPLAIYSSAQVRELDRIAIEQYGIAGYELMCRAGDAALSVLTKHWPTTQRILIYCGAGNNAGDGYVLGRLALEHGLSARIVTLIAPEELSGDAATAWRDCSDAGVVIEPWQEEAQRANSAADVIVDALLGTGVDRPLQGVFADAVQRMNADPAPVLSLDLPSGLDADSGAVLGEAVHADVTVTFVGLKQGSYLGLGPDYCGRLAYSDLDIPPAAGASLTPHLKRASCSDLNDALPPRRRTSHKGDNGRLLLVGGAPGMSGAIRLAAEAALRAGTGLVYVGTHADSVTSVMAGRPEIMCRPIAQGSELDDMIALADAAVLGPGLGQSDWSRAIWQRMINADIPLIVDADALNLLAQQSISRSNWAITPHPGEAARLLSIGAAEVQRDRVKALTALAEQYRASVVLKGACSLIATRDAAQHLELTICDRGNPGMGSAGMGDVLSGVIGALLVQCGELSKAVRAGVLLHALAGDDAAADGERGTIATDLLPYIRRWANPR